jgi:epoxyqueuosine reductase
VKRAKRRGYLRNAAVALGNLGDEAAMPVLAAVLDSEPEPMVRSHAAWALGRLGGRKPRQALSRAAEIETDGEVLNEIRSALGFEEQPPDGS